MRKLGVGLIVTGLLAGVYGLVAGPAHADSETQDIYYEFIFDDDPTKIWSGRATSNNAVIHGMVIHVSCSDDFAGGYSSHEGGRPDASLGDPQIVAFYLLKYHTEGDKEGEPHKEPCSLGSQQPLVPLDPCTEDCESECTEDCESECTEDCEEGSDSEVSAGGATTTTVPTTVPTTVTTVPSAPPVSAAVESVSLEDGPAQHATLPAAAAPAPQVADPTTLPAAAAPTPQVDRETLARTGAETDALVTLAGAALVLGGMAITFGESQAAVERRW